VPSRRQLNGPASPPWRNTLRSMCDNIRQESLVRLPRSRPDQGRSRGRPATATSGEARTAPVAWAVSAITRCFHVRSRSRRPARADRRVWRGNRASTCLRPAAAPAPLMMRHATAPPADARPLEDVVMDLARLTTQGFRWGLLRWMQGLRYALRDPPNKTGARHILCRIGVSIYAELGSRSGCSDRLIR